MNPIIRNILAVIGGIVIGSMVNMGIITLGPSIIPPPSGVDISTPEGLKAGMHLFEPKHYIFPFLAHALGTLAGAFTAAMLAAYKRMKIALGIGIFFLLGGIASVVMLSSPMWYTVCDLLLAYMPMAILGGRLAVRK